MHQVKSAAEDLNKVKKEEIQKLLKEHFEEIRKIMKIGDTYDSYYNEWHDASFSIELSDFNLKKGYNKFSDLSITLEFEDGSKLSLNFDAKFLLKEGLTVAVECRPVDQEEWTFGFVGNSTIKSGRSYLLFQSNRNPNDIHSRRATIIYLSFRSKNHRDKLYNYLEGK